MIFAVIDTNVLIRALIRPLGSVAPIISRLARNEYRVVYSEILWSEFSDKIVEPRLQKKYAVDVRAIHALYNTFVLRGEMVEPTRTITVCRDEDDNRVLEAAVAGRADYIVTGDKDLLVLDPFQGIRIVTPREFLSALDG